MRILIGIICMLGMLLSRDGFAMDQKEGDLQPVAVVLLGPPGAGKGTHAGPLSVYLGVPHISTGDLFRENIRKQTPVGKKAKSYIDEGNLVPDEVVLEMLFERTARDDCKRGYILDGFPRTLAQAQSLHEKIGNTHHFVVLNFNVPDAFLVERITGRMACKECGKPYHKKNDPPKQAGICDSCNGPLYQRDDDKEEVLVKRLEVYKKETKPLIEYYANQKVLHEIDSQNGKEQVFHDVLEQFPQATLSSHSQ